LVSDLRPARRGHERHPLHRGYPRDRIGEIKTALEEVRDETQEKHDNMPQSLRDGATGELLQGRADACEEAISALDSVYVDIPETEDEEKKDEAADAIWNGVVDAVEGISCE
jgi:hypothetical protein